MVAIKPFRCHSPPVLSYLCPIRLTLRKNESSRLSVTTATGGKMAPQGTHNRTVGKLWFVVIQAFVLCLGGLLGQQKEAQFPDIPLYSEYSLKLMQGLIPYRDFPVEYPPFSLVYFVLPRLLGLGQNSDVHLYSVAFLIQNLVVSVVLAFVLLRTIAQLDMNPRSRQITCFYTVLLAITAPFAAWRYDLLPALLTLLSVLFLVTSRSAIAGICLGLGIAAKLYPIIFIPIFCFYYLVSRQWRSLGKFLLFTISSIVIIFLPFWFAGGQILSFLNYHQSRGVHIESSFGGLLLLLDMLGLTQIEVVVNFGAFHLKSPLADVTLQLQSLLLVLGSILITIRCYLSFREEYTSTGVIQSATPVFYCVLMLLTFIALSKVFSAQYMVWLLPFIGFVQPQMYGLILAIYVLTTIIYPFYYWLLLAISPIGVLVLNLRNVLVFVLLIWLLLGQFFQPINRLNFNPES